MTLARLVPRTLAASLLAACLGSGLACVGEGYDNNDAELAVRQKAKETCSCLFVMQLSNGECEAWTKVTPNVAIAKVDWKNRRVYATALGFWSARASYRGRTGCTLD